MGTHDDDDDDEDNDKKFKSKSVAADDNDADDADDDKTLRFRQCRPAGSTTQLPACSTQLDTTTRGGPLLSRQTTDRREEERIQTAHTDRVTHAGTDGGGDTITLP
ncbi:unnamed protein product [Heligmosomoides polygyrus]|uniref:Uncharacterized protein n=1 Tax=Heligmosomoides polygyrus TaxID=6339 RepID=A0A183GET4_HELPZ|nr:unnamed protein product [Heligmosomoides polygyrus]